MPKLQQKLAKTLTRLRQAQGMSQETLGFESGYHRTYISQLERGLKNPTVKTLFDLAKALTVKPSEIIREIE